MDPNRVRSKHRKTGRKEDVAIQLSLVVPTYNERDNIDRLITSVAEAMGPSGISYELIIVDDNSPDRTADRARELSLDFPVVVHQRCGKLGLASAVTEGWERARGGVWGVMDADGSHDERRLVDMTRAVLEGHAELAIGSRYIPGGSLGNWPVVRKLISRLAIAMARPICPVADLTSGFFVCQRSVVEGVPLNPIGFKIGLEVMMRGNYQRFVEVPYVFEDRHQGNSKLSFEEVFGYVKQLLQLFVYWVSNRPLPQRVEWSSINPNPVD